MYVSSIKHRMGTRLKFHRGGHHRIYLEALRTSSQSSLSLRLYAVYVYISCTATMHHTRLGDVVISALQCTLLYTRITHRGCRHANMADITLIFSSSLVNTNNVI